MKVICYGNCNLCAIYSVLEGHPEIQDLSIMINFKYPLKDPTQVFTHQYEQIKNLQQCDVLIAQITPDSYGDLSIQHIIKYYIKSTTKVIFVPWYKSYWTSANTSEDAIQARERTFQAFEKADNLAKSLANGRPNSLGINMSNIYISKYLDKHFHHDETHPTFHFMWEICLQICKYLNIASPITTLKSTYTNPKSYFYDCYALNTHRSISKITRDTLKLTFSEDIVPPTWDSLK